MFAIEEIMKLIPHRPPFLWVDKITELDPGKRCVGLKKIASSSDFFKGHFPGDPILPGVYIIEASAQAADPESHCFNCARQTVGAEHQ